jgi:tetratricopeptide (TPR) repeat protein
MRDLCFVLMPFGRKQAPDSNLIIDFDAVYAEIIQPAIDDAGLEPLRADEEMTGGVIHKPMFERLILCRFAVADMTTANANVFYELGVRHAVKPQSTVLLFAEGGRLPFDVAPLRALPYQLSADGKPSNAGAARKALRGLLEHARNNVDSATDSPIYQMVDDYPNIQHEKTDVFRKQVEYARKQKEELANARRSGIEALRAFEANLGDLNDVEAGVLIDLFLSYRAVKGWKEMIALAAKMPKPIANTVMAREQLALALNRDGQSEAAESVLLELINAHGPSSETNGILGRVYKDRWEAAAKSGSAFAARGALQKAIDAYLRGFETDWRDAYPGINAVTLMELREPPDPRQADILPVVRYAVTRKVAAGKPDYWDFATLVELAILARDEAGAMAATESALGNVREKWEPETTLRNLRLIDEARTKRGEQTPPWVAEIMGALAEAAK